MAGRAHGAREFTVIEGTLIYLILPFDSAPKNTFMVTERLDVPEMDEHRNAAVQLDGIASDVGAGVIVAGAYGHSRFRELILGGMTQHLITQSARCALLSH